MAAWLRALLVLVFIAAAWIEYLGIEVREALAGVLMLFMVIGTLIIILSPLWLIFALIRWLNASARRMER